ncbi:Pol polyprotein/retrotransposon, putative, partial [Rhizoctonia solani AG-3 Rhs1AP]
MTNPEPDKAGPSYFDKGKWQCNEDYEAQQAHKRQVEAPRSSREASTRAKKARPSIGIRIDELVPEKAKPEKRSTTPNVARNLELSIAALPERGYFADNMRTFLAKEKKPKKAEKARAYIPETSDPSESDSDESTTEKNRKNREKYRAKEKTRKEQRENKRLRRQVRELKRASIKIKEPEKYRGQEDFDAFEMWDYQVNSWLRKTGYKGAEAVEWVGSLLSGKASRWYMDYVAPNPSLYTVESLRLALYMYCFPPDMKARLRSEFRSAQQGNQRFTDYLRHLKRLQRRLPDITDRNLCIKLWETVHTYIRVKWTEAGLAQEVTDLETLTEMAERFEAAEEIKRRSQPRSWQQRNGQQGNSRLNQTNQQPQTKAPEHNPKGESSKQGSNSKAQNGKAKEKPKSDKPRSDKTKMSREERDELRAAGKCFNCKEHGHTVKDCPSRNKAKPSNLFSAAIQYSQIDDLRKERAKTYIGVASIRPCENPSPASSGTVLSEITPGRSLLDEVLDEITPYAQIVVAETDRLKVTNDEAREVEITYREIAKLVREEYLHQLERRARENNLGTASNAEEQTGDGPECKEEADESWEPIAWSDSDDEGETLAVEINALRLDKGKKPETAKAIERNASKPKDVARRMPKPIVAEVLIEGKKVRALFDSGSLGDFISTTVVDQLKLKRETLANPIGLQMAVQGSRSMINYSVDARISFQTIDYTRRFDVINIDNYDMILGTPFLFQHKILMGFNPPSVAVGSAKPLPINDGELVIEIKAHVAELFESKVEKCREELRAAGADLCKTMADTALPPFRAINHTIPLIDESKRYHSRRVQCPKPLQGLWDEKFRAYLDTNRWEHRPGSNAIPMLILMKKSKDGKTAVRTVLDKREINANTHKLASPLPDINDILAEVSRHPYRSLIDGKDAYEQIRVVPEHVERTLFMTPNGTMVSKVMQQGDCNAGATYQALMNHIFADFIGKFMYVYLDDIIIFSDTVEDHIKHVKMVFDVLRREKLYLSPGKMQLFAERLEILGHVITSDGISMDPHKVDAIEKWKAPTSKEQIMSFLGAVGYLAPNCPNVRIPMSVLSKRAAASQPWRWEATEQRAFQEIKDLVSAYRNHNRVALDYSPGAPPINLTTDACCTGASGVISQGEDIQTAKIAAFWSGKFTATQQNYPVHEQELLAIKESLERFKHLVQGVHVRVFTDHKALEYFNTQQKMSARQVRWMEKINEFDIEVNYIPGETNILADGLSRMYSNETNGVKRAKTEYVDETDQETPHILVGSTSITEPPTTEVTKPLYVGDEVKAEFKLLQGPRRSSRVRKQVDRYGQKPTPERNPRNKRVTVEKVEDKEAPKITAPKAEKIAEKTVKEEPQQAETKVETDTLETEEKTPLAKCVTEAQLPDCIVGQYKNDTLLKAIAQEPEKYSNFEIKTKYSTCERKATYSCAYQTSKWEIGSCAKS